MFETTGKKIQVEAEVTTTKNVSSGIGKGFGIVIGVFLALIVIAVSCGILISSNAKKIEERSNEITANAIKEAYRASDEAQQQIQTQLQKRIDNSLPVDEKVKEKTEDFRFNPNSIVATQNGISLSLDNFIYVNKGDDWGKITTIDLSILNKGSNAIHPKVLILLYDDKSLKEEWTQPKAEINFDMWSLGVNEHVSKSILVNVPFHNLNLTKKFRLVLTDAFDYNNYALAVVEKDFNATKI